MIVDFRFLEAKLQMVSSLKWLPPHFWLHVLYICHISISPENMEKQKKEEEEEDGKETYLVTS